VPQPIPAQAVTVGASSKGGRHGKGPLRIATPPDSDAESGDEVNVNVYLNTAMFVTQAVTKC
jgi:hypothetical protein